VSASPAECYIFMLPNHWQREPSLAGPLPSVGTYSPPHTESAQAGTPHDNSIRHSFESSFPNAPSGSPSAPPKSLSSRHCRIVFREYHSEHDIQSVAALQLSSHHHPSSASVEQQQRPSSQHCVTSASLPSSPETFSFDRRHSIAGFAPSFPRKVCRTDRAMATIPIRGAHAVCDRR